jgi:hypothetical protein
LHAWWWCSAWYTYFYKNIFLLNWDLTFLAFLESKQYSFIAKNGHKMLVFASLCFFFLKNNFVLTYSHIYTLSATFCVFNRLVICLKFTSMRGSPSKVTLLSLLNHDNKVDFFQQYIKFSFYCNPYFLIFWCIDYSRKRGVGKRARNEKFIFQIKCVRKANGNLK